MKNFKMVMSRGTLSDTPELFEFDSSNNQQHVDYLSTHKPGGVVSYIDLDRVNGIIACTVNGASYLDLYTYPEWVKLPDVPSPPAGTPRGLHFSPDGSYLAVVTIITGNFLKVYDTSDWSSITVQQPSDDAFDCRFSPDGSTLAVVSKAGNQHNLNLYDTTTWNVTNPLPLTSDDCKSCDWSPDGSVFVMALYINSSIHAYNTSDWSEITLAARAPEFTDNVRFNQDGSYLFCTNTGTSIKYGCFNTTTWNHVFLEPIISFITSGIFNGIAWISPSLVAIAGNGQPGVVVFDVTTGFIYNQFNELYDINALVLLSLGEFEINGTIEESLVATDWIAYVHDLVSGNLIASTKFTGNSFSLDLPYNNPVSVTVAAEQGIMWEATSSKNINNNVFSTDPTSTPYYYVATIGGITGATEPVWPVNAGGTVVDGSVTWERVERLIQSVTQSPLIPTVK